MPLDQPRRPVTLAGGERVPQGVVGQALVLVPGRGGAVELRDPLGLLLPEAGPEQVGEQLMVAPPAPDLVQGDQEQIRPLQPLQHLLAPGSAGDRITQRPTQPLQHTGRQQKLAHQRGLAVQDLGGQIVQDRTVAAREAGHEPGRVGVVAQRQPGQLEAGGPAFGAGGQGGHRLVGQGLAGVPGQQGGGFGGAKAQVGGADLGQLAAGPQAGQGQGRVGPAGQHQPQPRRRMLQQQADAVVDRRRLDQVVVVDHQHELVAGGPGGELVDQGRHQPLGRGRVRAAQQPDDLLGHPRAHPLQGRGHVAPEPDRVVIAGIQRQPGHRPAAGPGPVGQQARLAAPGRGTDQQEPAGQALVQPLHQPRADGEPGPGPGHVQLGREQDVLPGGGRLGHPDEPTWVLPPWCRAAAAEDSTRRRHLGVMAGAASVPSVLGDGNPSTGGTAMAVLRVTRFKTDPADAEAMLGRRADLIAAVRRDYPGLLHAQLAKVDDETWIDAWRWDSRDHAQAAIGDVPNIPEAGAAFSLTRDATAEFADLVDER